jgi:hypothetical protein
METRGVGRPTDGSRQHATGRRLRTAVLGAIAVSGAIFMGGAASLVTAFANTGAITASETCTSWTASASLHSDVTADKIIDVVVTPSTLTTGLTGLTGQSPTSTVQIWSRTGAAPQTGATFTINIYSSVDNAGLVRVLPAVFSQTTLPLTPATDCTTTPTIATTPSGTATVGKAIHDVATVTGSGASPTGTVIFKLYGPDNTTCNVDGSAAVFTSTAITLVPTTTAGVSTATSPDFTPTAPGTYHWIARYSGDGGVHYNPVSSACELEAVPVSKAAPTIATSQSAGGNIGVVLSDTATVSGGSSPTGTVTFVLFPPSNATCSANGTAAVYTSPAETLSGGKATSGSYTTTSAAGAGTYRWVATYSGDANNNGAASGCTAEALTVSGGSSVLGITSPGGVSGLATPSTGGASDLTGMTIGGFLLLGGLGFLLAGMMLPRRRSI